MGGASSKAARKLPKRREGPSWAGARTPASAEPDNSNTLSGRRPTLASETKNEAIERDSRDPQFLANLSRLGPVRVDHHMRSVRPEGMTNVMHRARAQSESEANTSQATRNRLLASTLSNLLDERKPATSLEALEKIAVRYDMDITAVQSVSRFVNSPSIAEDSTVTTVGEDGQEKVCMTAAWVEPSIGSQPRLNSGQ